MPQLLMLHYWKLPKSPKVIEIRERLQAVFSDSDSGPPHFSTPLDVDQLAMKLYGLQPLPFRDKLEAELQESLHWIRVRLAQREALSFVRRDWLVHGECILFAAEEPSLDSTREAVLEVLLRRKHIEK